MKTRYHKTRPWALRRPLLVFACLAGLLTADLQSALAQDRPGYRPGRIGEGIEKPRTPKSRLDLPIPESTGQKIPKEAEDIRFRLEVLEIEGGEAFGEDTIRQFYDDLLGSEISLADLYRATAKVTKDLRERGYILSMALVPAQRIKDGKARITVVAGYISEVVYSGPDPVRQLVLSYVEDLASEDPLRLDELERALLLASDAAGITVKSVLRPAKEGLGASELAVVAEWDRFDGSVTYDNHGTKYTGPNRHLWHLDANSLLLQGERMSVDYVRTGFGRELKYYAFQLDTPIGRDGFGVRADVSYSTTVPGFTLRPLRVDGWTKTGEVSAYYKVLRSRRKSLELEAGFGYSDVFTNQNEAEFQRDRIRTAFVGGVFDIADPLGGITLASATVHHGLGILNATSREDPVASRNDTRPSFWKADGELRRIQPLYRWLNFQGAVEWQYSPGPLLSSEEFSVGGRTMGKAYDSGEISGDRGIAGKIELHLVPPELPTHVSEFDIYGFYDLGWVRNLDDDAAQDDKKLTLASAGAGVKVGVMDHLTITLEAAFPLTRPPETVRGDQEKDNWNDYRFFGAATLEF